ncbi:helix-turn-helix domain-containing protein [Streptomyces fulvorobeus]|uniref:Transcriptional regulator with XRE-family HTH domain n=1 Tax=Streptomyces fulvorobeus TaxID=284028 RepID=A0A7Y9KYY7_9ACTN|nr:XRE family transcriptional regulator [Streptomyces fulvorobeus]NYE44489.1 transcriptional regulator with XRE-family HTH domain [Streptomyces fulvorobeus]
MTAEHARLTAALRELRARTGLSLAALSQRTAYSKSSWERYLNGKSLPPRKAVRELCRIANEADSRLLALWEIAESDWSGRAADPTPAPAEPRPRRQPQESPRPSETGRPHGRKGRLVVALASAYTVIVVAVALVFFLLPDERTPREEPLSASAPYSLAPQCRGAACEGRDPLRLVCGIGPDTLTTYRTATGAHLELRYSEKCGASWVRTWGARIGDRVEVTAGGPTHDVRIEDRADAETYVYTEMTTARPGSTVRACFRPASADGEPECVEVRVGAPPSTVGRPHVTGGARRNPP